MKIIFIAIVISIIALSSCETKDPELPNEEELITTLKYTLTPANSADAIVLTFKDLDGDGGQTPVISGGTLQANTAYKGILQLSNDLASPVINISEEIKTESDVHQFFFSTSIGLNLAVSYDDFDGVGKPLGLTTKIQTGTASSGKLTITLRHEPNKSATGVAQGNIANAGGETDIEVSFDLVIK